MLRSFARGTAETTLIVGASESLPNLALAAMRLTWRASNFSRPGTAVCNVPTIVRSSAAMASAVVAAMTAGLSGVVGVGLGVTVMANLLSSTTRISVTWGTVGHSWHSRLHRSRAFLRRFSLQKGSITRLLRTIGQKVTYTVLISLEIAQMSFLLDRNRIKLDRCRIELDRARIK